MPASSKEALRLSGLIGGYCLCARSEGKSPRTVEAVVERVGYLDKFLRSEGRSSNISDINSGDIRAFIIHLQHKRRFSEHPFARPQQGGLSEHTINSYLRSVRAFWSWLVSEGFIQVNPFDKVRVSKPPLKVIPTFSDHQLEALLGAIDTSTPEGFRDYVIILTLLDTGLRVSELTGLGPADVWLDDGVLKVLGKARKERLVPIGKAVQRLLWKYISYFRPEPAVWGKDLLFVTAAGRPVSRNRIEKRMASYGQMAGLKGIRCSPHTLRHTAAVRFLRNGGDVFSLQRMLGHSTLQMTRHYCELADVDVKTAHLSASPVDNLGLGWGNAAGRIAQHRLK